MAAAVTAVGVAAANEGEEKNLGNGVRGEDERDGSVLAGSSVYVAIARGRSLRDC